MAEPAVPDLTSEILARIQTGPFPDDTPLSTKVEIATQLVLAENFERQGRPDLAKKLIASSRPSIMPRSEMIRQVGTGLAQEKPIAAALGGAAANAYDVVGLPPELAMKLGGIDPTDASDIRQSFHVAGAERPWTVGLAQQAGTLTGYGLGLGAVRALPVVGTAIKAAPGVLGEAAAFAALEAGAPELREAIAERYGVETTPADGTVFGRAGRGALTGAALGVAGPLAQRLASRLPVPVPLQRAAGTSAVLGGLSGATALEGERLTATAQGMILGAGAGAVSGFRPFSARRYEPQVTQLPEGEVARVGEFEVTTARALPRETPVAKRLIDQYGEQNPEMLWRLTESPRVPEGLRADLKVNLELREQAKLAERAQAIERPAETRPLEEITKSPPVDPEVRELHGGLGLPGAPTEALPRAPVGYLREKVAGMAHRILDPFRQTFPKMAREDADLSGFGDRRIAASYAGEFTSRLHNDRMLKLAKGDADFHRAYMIWLYGEQAHGIRARGGEAARRVSQARRAGQEADPADVEAVEQLARLNVPALTPESARKLQADPRFKALDEYWKNAVQPDVESLAEDAGVKTRRDTPSGNYVMLRSLQEGEVAPSEIAVSPRYTSGTGALKNPPRHFRKRTARAAKQATGTADRYSTDPLDILQNMFRDRYTSAYHNQFLSKVKTYAAQEDANGQIPKMVTWRGQEVPWQRITIRAAVRRSGKDAQGKRREYVDSGEIQVPKPVADYYDRLMTLSKGSPEMEALKQAHSFLVGWQLATPAEAIVHASSLLNVLGTTPGIGRSSPVARVAALTGGSYGRFFAALSDAVNVHGPRADAWAKTLAEHGATRAEAVGHGWLDKIPGLGHLKRAVFDMPDLERRGFHGLETRARVAMAQTLEARYPSLSRSEIARMVNGRLGTYVTEMQPIIVRWGKPIDPFANFGLAKIKTGLNTEILRGPSGFNGRDAAELLWTYHVMTPVLMAVTVKALDAVARDEDPTTGGRWPWEIPGLRLGYARVDAGPQGVTDLPIAQMFASTWWRTMRHIGVAGIYDSWIKGERDHGDLLDEMVRGGFNAALGRVGAFPRMLGVMATGRVPYVTASGEPMQVVPPTAAGSQVVENVKHAGRHFWSLAGELSDTYAETGQHPLIRSPSEQVKHILGTLTGFDPRYGPPEADSAVGAGFQEQGEAFDVARDVSFRARRLRFENDAEAREWITRQILERVPLEEPSRVPDTGPFKGRRIGMLQARAIQESLRSYLSRPASVRRQQVLQERAAESPPPP